jgi:hypothetical protein
VVQLCWWGRSACPPRAPNGVSDHDTKAGHATLGVLSVVLLSLEARTSKLGRFS